MVNDGSSWDMRGECKGAYRDMKSFDVVLILLLLNKVLGISDIICQALQWKSLDILNALKYASRMKRLLQEFQVSGRDDFIRSMLDMSDCYMEGTRCFCQQKYYVIVEHHYHIDVFNVVINFQLMELNSKFS